MAPGAMFSIRPPSEVSSDFSSARAAKASSVASPARNSSRISWASSLAAVMASSSEVSLTCTRIWRTVGSWKVRSD